MTAYRVVGRLAGNYGWSDRTLVEHDPTTPDVPIPPGLAGAAAWVSPHAADPGRVTVARDPLGLNKLFWATGPDGDLLFAPRPRDLIDAGCGFGDVRAVAAGTVHTVDFERGRVASSGLNGAAGADEPIDDVSRAAELVADRLDAYVRALARAHGDRPVYVCMSGGLDSTGIAVLTAAHFRNPYAVSFDLVRRSGHTSEDRRVAERLARDLDVPLITASVPEDDLLDLLDRVLVDGIDWRDFNVHAALVNAALAATIAEHAQGAEALVLTGDLMNEYLIDYHAEVYRGNTYYALPNLPLPKLQMSLIRGMESCHRELGVFEGWGLAACQPYAVVADVYTRLAEPILAATDRKDALAQAVFGDRIPPYVYARPKTRAQVGDPESGRGVLSLCVDRGRDQAWLRRRFAELHDTTEAEVARFIRAGRYRSGVPNLEGTVP